MATEKEETGVYCALEKCVVVESRFSVMQKIITSINSSFLFENVIQAESLSDGIDKIRTLNVDACFVGSSIAPQNIEVFLEKASKVTRSSDCAFVAMVNKDRPEELPQIAKAHGVISWPCSKENFTLNVVKAVVSANKDSPLKPLLLALERGEVLVRMTKKAPRTVSGLIAGCAEGLKKIAKAIESKEYGLDSTGNPDIEAKKDIDNVVSQLASRFEDEKESDKLKEFLNRVLSEWVVNQITLSSRDAKSILSREFLGFYQ